MLFTDIKGTLVEKAVGKKYIYINKIQSNNSHGPNINGKLGMVNTI